MTGVIGNPYAADEIWAGEMRKSRETKGTSVLIICKSGTLHSPVAGSARKKSTGRRFIPAAVQKNITVGEIRENFFYPLMADESMFGEPSGEGVIW